MTYLCSEPTFDSLLQYIEINILTFHYRLGCACLSVSVCFQVDHYLDGIKFAILEVFLKHALFEISCSFV